MSLEIFSDLSDKTIELERHQFLKMKDSVDTNVYLVESGGLKLYVLDGSEEQIIRFGYQGNMLVALDSYLTGKPSPYFIQAIRKSVVKVVSKSKIEAFVNASNENLKYWIQLMEAVVVQQLERELDLLTDLPRERYERVLKRSPRLFQEIPNRYIANYLRMSPETLSRLKSRP